MRNILRILTPLLLHMAVSDGVTVMLRSFAGKWADASLCVSVSAVLVILFAWWMMRADGREAELKLSFQVGNHPAALTLFGLAGGIVNLLWSRVLYFFSVQERFSNTAQEQLFAGPPLIQVIGLGLLVPLAEELIFRALIYTRMRQLFSARLAIFFSALLFAVYHGNPIQILFAFPMALLLAILYERTGRFLVPSAFHAGANLTAVFLNML